MTPYFFADISVSVVKLEVFGEDLAFGVRKGSPGGSSMKEIVPAGSPIDIPAIFLAGQIDVCGAR